VINLWQAWRHRADPEKGAVGAVGVDSSAAAQPADYIFEVLNSGWVPLPALQSGSAEAAVQPEASCAGPSTGHSQASPAGLELMQRIYRYQAC
jgi:hypothetical protein